jgi:hypothetical protein
MDTRVKPAYDDLRYASDVPRYNLTVVPAKAGTTLL